MPGGSPLPCPWVVPSHCVPQGGRGWGLSGALGQGTGPILRLPPSGSNCKRRHTGHSTSTHEAGGGTETLSPANPVGTSASLCCQFLCLERGTLAMTEDTNTRESPCPESRASELRKFHPTTTSRPRVIPVRGIKSLKESPNPCKSVRGIISSLIRWFYPVPRPLAVCQPQGLHRS